VRTAQAASVTQSFMTPRVKLGARGTRVGLYPTILLDTPREERQALARTL
jgi:hypothetical protein